MMPETNIQKAHPIGGRPFPWHCPRCRANAVRPATIPYECERAHGGQTCKVVVPALVVPRCGSCNELVFDFSALQQIRNAFDAHVGLNEANRNGDLDLNIPMRSFTPYHAAYYANKLAQHADENDKNTRRMLWQLTRHELAGKANFRHGELSFELFQLDDSWPDVPAGCYEYVNDSFQSNCHVYSLSHPLAQEVTRRARERQLRTVTIRFDYSRESKRARKLEALVGKSGCLRFARLAAPSPEEDKLLFAALDDNGASIESKVCAALFDVGGEVMELSELGEDEGVSLQSILKQEANQIEQQMGHGEPMAQLQLSAVFAIRWAVV